MACASTDSIHIMARFNCAAAADVTAPNYNPVQLASEILQQCKSIEREVLENIRACGDADSQVRLRGNMHLGAQSCWSAAQQEVSTRTRRRSVCCTAQEIYEAACTALFVALDRLDEQLSNQRCTTVHP